VGSTRLKIDKIGKKDANVSLKDNKIAKNKKRKTVAASGRGKPGAAQFLHRD
jgi:hypothetical protein